MLNDINTVIPGYLTQLDGVATTLRDQVNNADERHLGHARSRRAEPERGRHPAVRHRGRRRRVRHRVGRRCRLVGRGRRGRAADRVAGGVGHGRSGAGNTTATVTTNVDGSLSVAIAPTATHSLQVQASGANAGFSTLLGTTPVGSDGIGGRQFFTGTGASTLAVSALVAGNPGAIAAGVAGSGPLDGSVALSVADIATSSTGADAGYQTMIVKLGVDAKDVQTRDNVQQQSVQNIDAVAERSSRGQHRRRDDEHGRVPEGVRGRGEVRDDASTRCSSTLINMVWPVRTRNTPTSGARASAGGQHDEPVVSPTSRSRRTRSSTCRTASARSRTSRTQASTGKKLTKPSDSPVDIGQSLQLRAVAEPQHPDRRQHQRRQGLARHHRQHARAGRHAAPAGERPRAPGRQRLERPERPRRARQPDRPDPPGPRRPREHAVLRPSAVRGNRRAAPLRTTLPATTSALRLRCSARSHPACRCR